MTRADRYSGLSTINHWVTALLVIAMLTLGFVGGFAPNEETEEYVMGIHVALGFFVFLFVLWRVAYRLIQGFPENVGETAFERTAAYWVHRLLLLVLILQVFSGPLYLFTENEGVNVFGWFTVAIPLESLEVIHEPMEAIHVYTGLYLIPILLVLHFLGALKHYLRDRQHMPADM